MINVNIEIDYKLNKYDNCFFIKDKCKQTNQELCMKQKQQYLNIYLNFNSNISYTPTIDTIVITYRNVDT